MSKKQYGLTSDVYFKCLFGSKGNESITKNFIESIIGEKMDSVTTDYKLELDKSSIVGKQMITDLIAKDQNLRKYIIEMQRKTHSYLPKRFLGYLSKAYVSDIKVSEDYDNLKRTVLIIIMKEDFPGISDISDYHTIWNFREQKHKDKILHDSLQVHIIELNKYIIQKHITKIVEPWLEFLINPYGKEVTHLAKTSEDLRKAVEQLRLLEADEDVRRLADAEDFARLDRNSELKEEREIGRFEGHTKGLLDGEKKAKLEMAKKLLKINTPIETVLEVTGLERYEIEKIS